MNINFNDKKNELLKQKDNILKEFEELYFDCLDFGLNLVQIINVSKYSENDRVELEKLLEDEEFKKISMLHDSLKRLKNLDQNDDTKKHKIYIKK